MFKAEIHIKHPLNIYWVHLLFQEHLFRYVFNNDFLSWESKKTIVNQINHDIKYINQLGNNHEFVEWRLIYLMKCLIITTHCDISKILNNISCRSCISVKKDAQVM